QVEPTQHVLLLTLHHIIADGWSMGLIVREVMALYKEGDHAALPELPIQYADYAVWQQRQQQSEDYQDRLENWVSQLADAPALLKLPTDLPRPAVQTFNGGIVRRTTSAQLSQQLQRFSQRHGTTLFTTLMSAFATLMYRYSQQSDLVIATPIAGREHPDLENLVGFFVNTLPLRIQLSEGESFETLLNYVQTVSLDAFDNQDVPFAQLIESLPLERDPSYLPLCQVMFALQNAPQAKFELPDLTLESLSTHAGIAQYDLTLSASIEEDGLICNWEYNSDLFAVETVERVAANFEHLLEQIVQNASDSVNRLSLLEKDQQQQLLSLAERPDRVNEPLRPVHEWFEAQVEQSPDAVALVGRKNSETENSDIESWSYRQLNERANQIARHLQVAGIGANQIVAVCVERSNHQIAALLAVLKLGAAYLPMDPSYPSERLRLMLEEAQATALITRKHIQTRHGLQASNTIDIADERIAAYPTTNLGQTVGLDERAYIIFTSGSTGKPKGTELTHRGLANFVQQSRVQYGFGSDERVLQFASISFDAAVEEIYLTLCSGGTLLLRDDEMIASSEAFCRVSAEQQLTVWDLPTAFWHRLTKDIAQGLATLPDSLRTVIIGGEKVQAQIVQQWQQIDKGRNVRLLNTYGPTEATVVATFYEVASDWQYTPGVDVPIGRPLGNVEAYVLDRHRQLAPLGVAGELYLGGLGLAMGYLNQPELSAERFIAHPFKLGDRLYRTGDLVRMIADGDLHYMGRADDQVKIRGFRVELGEIESAIGQLDVVREVAVICREDTPGKQTLCAYVVPRADESFDAIALKKELRKELPEYMVPTYIVQMDSLPLTGNNKVDRKALPVPQSEDLATETRYQAPRNQTEAELVAIWESLLEVSSIGIEDSFFELGGHSLLAMQLVSRIQQQFQVQLSLASLFQNPTIAATAKQIANSQASGSFLALVDIPVAERTQPLPITVAQQRIWLLEQMEDMDGAYNMAACQRVRGELDVAVLDRCLAFLASRHESLRTTFHLVDEQPVQLIHESLPCKVDYAVMEELDDVTESVIAFMSQPFDLTTGPLLRVKLIQTAPREQILMVSIHHIISDGWSLGLLTQEMMSIYPALAQGQTPLLPELPIQVADFARWQRELLQGEYLQTQLDYWRQQLGDAPARLELPSDRPRLSEQTFAGSTLSAVLPTELSAKINRFSQQSGVSLYMTLLAAFGILLHRYSAQEEVFIGSPIANRNHPQVQGLIGLFLNTLVLRLDCGNNPRFTDFIQQIKETAIGAYAHQDTPFEQLLEILPSDRQQNTSPWFQVMFILQNNKEIQFSLPGVELEPINLDMGVAKFDLTLSVEETHDGLLGKWEYNCDLFDKDTIERMAACFEHLLAQLVEDAEQPIDAVPLLSAGEQQRMHSLSVQESVTAEPLRPVHEWFEQQAKEKPEAIALTARNTSWRYAQLNQQANQIARHLQSVGVSENYIVALCLERSPELIAALLAVLKVGAAYLPMDPTYPAERLHQMVEDAQVAALVTREEIQSQLNFGVAQVIDVDDAAIQNQSIDDLDLTISLEQRAYVIFTSGSTGRPKGTELTHRGLANFVQQSTVQYGFGSDERVLQFASISFDAAVEEIYLTLCSGGMLVLRTDEMIASTRTFCQLSAEQQLTVWDLPTAFWQRLTQDVEQGLAELPESLRIVIIGGEKVQPQIVQQWQQIVQGRNVRLLNTYGPTEATVVATFYEVTSDWQYVPGVDVPIGRPLGNVESYILDAHMQLVPLGVAGELYLGGPGLAAGYLNRPELTAERFVAHPFMAGERLYRTGDLAKMSADGNLHYLGRADDQVKIRGFRVELGEVEALVQQLDTVRECAVVVHPNEQGVVRLIAYVVTDKDEIVSQTLRQALLAKAPDYLVPALFMPIAEIPLTPAGKLNRKALPLPQKSDWTVEQAYVAPRTLTETGLAAIAAEVLGLDRVGVTDNFFALGGHSLAAMQILARIRTQTGKELSLRTLFSEPTVEALAREIEGKPVESASEETASDLAVKIPQCDRTQPIPLSSAQQRLWFLDRFEGASATYNLPFALRLTGELDVAALKQCLNEIVERHEALRTRFADVAGQGVQLVQPPFSLEISVEAIANEEVLTHRLQAEAQTPFDLETEPLLRVKLLQVEPTQHVLLLTLHHIIADGWSMGLIVREVMALYKEGDHAALPELPIQYADYAVWQQRQQQSEDYQDRLENWVSQLADAPALLKLPTDLPRPAVQTFNGGIVRRTTSAQLSQQLQRFSQRHGTTLFTTLMSAFATLMYRYSQQSDLVIATPIAGREHPDLENLVGFFVNTLPLRIQLSEGESFETLLNYVQTVSLDAFDNQDVPFAQLIESLPLERDPSYLPLCQVMFALQNAPQAKFELPDLTLESLSTHAGIAQYDLTLSASIEEDGLICNWEYNSDLFAVETVERVAANFEHLLEQIVQNASDSVNRLSLLEKDQQQQLLSLAERPDRVNEPLRPVHEWFEAQVEQSPDAVALVGRKNSETENSDIESWSYRQLNERANQIARHLQVAGIGANQIVAVCVERSNHQIAALLAVLKLGAAYLPMDPSYPSERLRLMLEEAQATALITRKHIQTRHGLQASNTIDIADERIAAYPTTNLGQTVGLDERAYIIFTSGSTGKPKGTELTHRGLANFVQQSRVQYGFGSDERVLQFASISFDAAVEEIYLTLCSGGTLLLRDDEMIASSEAFCRVSAEQQLTVWDLPTAFWHRLTKDIAQGLATLPDSLRTVIIGGEKVQAQIVQQWQQIARGRNVRLLNTYGPTEATVVATFYEVSASWQYLPGADVPIGRPLGNIETYILDQHLQLAPLGVAGELYLGGPCLAAGYLNQPELSAERFIAHPFKPGSRLYRTGDLVRMTADGELHYMGRADNQVKIRGFRVELGEIESAIAQLAAIREVTVICREDTPGKQTLCAYVVAPLEESIDAIALKKELRKELRQRLPEYMVPTYIVQMDALPLTGNNKVDRKALPVPQSEDLVTESRYQAPRNPTETELVAIWESLLEVSPIGIEDSFFELGGHSLLAMQLVSQIQQHFQVQLPLAALFQSPSASAIAALITDAQTNESPVTLAEIPVADRTQPLPVTIAQQRIWLLEQMEDMDGAYNMPICLQVQGEFKADVLNQCIAFMMERHESLRTTFRMIDEQPVQIVHESLPAQVEYEILEGSADIESVIAQYIGQPFDLVEGPLLRAKLIQRAPQQQILLVVIHHIIADGWSLGILTQEIASIYPALAQGQMPQLPKLPIQVADFAQWQRQLLQGEYLKAQLDYWQQQLGDAPARLDLPTDRPRPATQTFRGSTVSQSLPVQLSQQISRFSQQAGVSLYMTLLAAFGVLLHRYSGQAEVLIGSPIANRNHPQVQGLIGLFLNTLVLRLDCSDNPQFSDFLEQVKAVSLGAYAHQDAPFEQLIEILPSDRQQNTSPWFQVMFILQNNKEPDLLLPDIKVSPLELDGSVAKFELTLSVEETEEGLVGDWEYNSDLFNRETIEQMATNFEQLLSELMKNAQRTIDQAALLSTDEQQQLRFLGVQRGTGSEPLRPVHEWFEQQVAASPDAAALTASSNTWSYAQLNQRANQIARHLQSVGVSENHLVALCLERSPELIAALLAVLKVGAAYLPMDPTYPAERLHQMVEDAQVAALVTKEAIQSQLSFDVAQVVDI
ncbi:MAG: amino acid adenylation domain-containing protein, partial [Cyanobacteria bacterium J06614_10]